MLVITFISMALAIGIVSFSALAASAPHTGTARQTGDYVVLLHGMGRTSASMKRVEWFLSRQNYRVINSTYRTANCSIQELADDFLGELLREKITDTRARVFFVTHSLGGIILRQYLSNHEMTHFGRAVMLAPPNSGSEILESLKACPLAHPFLGPTGRELGTGLDSVPRRLGPVQFDCGVIAGDRCTNPVLSCILGGPSDGKLTVESTKVQGMKDFLVLPSTHTWISWRTRTLLQVGRYLKYGSFDHQQKTCRHAGLATS